MIKRLGLVLECDAGGPDELVLKCLVRRLSPGTEVIVRTMGNKEALFERGADVARDLVDIDGCDLVLIVWDLKPPWDKPRSCVNETQRLLDQLAPMPNPPRSQIRLLCLSYELETWLLADASAVQEHLSTAAHPVKIRAIKKLEQVQDPKALLDKLCTDHRGASRRYVDFREAIQIARRWTSSVPLCRITSFARFLTLLTGTPNTAFQHSGDVCNDLVHGAAMMGRR